MKKSRPNRRRLQRIRPDRTLIGRLDSVDVLIVDLSAGGAAIEHVHPFPLSGRRMLSFRSDGQQISARCSITRSRLHRVAGGPGGANIYRSGVRFLDFDENSSDRLRELVSEHNRRMLAVQKANVTGESLPIDFERGEAGPPTFEARSPDFRTNPAIEALRKAQYISFRREGPRWVRVHTHEPHQPEDGFTVSLREPADDIDLLVDTYRLGDRHVKQLIRLFADLSLRSHRKDDSDPTT